MPISKNYSFLIVGVIVASIIGVVIIGLPQYTEDSLPKPSDDVTKPGTAKSEIKITSVDKIKDTSDLMIFGISKASSEGTQLVEVKLGDGEYFPATPNRPDDWSEWSLTLDTSTLDDGIHELVARVIDNSGNEELYGIPFNLNLNPITITNPPYDVIVAGGPITITGNIDTQRIDAKVVEVKLGDGEYIAATPTRPDDWSEWSITLDTSTLDDGIHELVARVIDNSGNEELDGIPFNLNLNPITITNPPYDVIVAGGPITITGNIDTQRIDAKVVEVKLGDGEYTAATPTRPDDWSEWSITLDTSTLNDGTHELVARVIDNSGNEKLDGRSFNYIPELIIITNPLYDAMVSGNPITITGNIDTQRIEAKVVEVKLGDGEYIAATPTRPDDWSEWSLTLDTSTLNDGTHELVARVIDNSGNEEWDNRLINFLSNIGPIEINDDFSDGKYDMELGTISPDSNWFAVWHDEGYLGVTEDFKDISNNVFVVESGAVGEITDTKSAMILSTHQYKNFKLSVDVRTDKQTRLNDPPNAWEVGWLVWTYEDPTHFNYFLLKSNGAEMGKYDGGVNPTHQKILFTNSLAQTSIGDWTNWQVLVQDSHVTIFADDTKVFDFYDFSSFDTGRIGFYLEDASVSFDNFEIIPLT